VVLLTCSYRGKEFVRVGYYVNNEYSDPEMRETPPATPIYEKLNRNILATQPRVTRFKIEWDDQKMNGVSQSQSQSDTGEITMNGYEQQSMSSGGGGGGAGGDCIESESNQGGLVIGSSTMEAMITGDGDHEMTSDSLIDDL
jgi:histone chaperone ASF1